MKQLLLSVAMFLMGASAFAWTIGEEITGDVNWGNLSFTSNPMDYWRIDLSKGSTTQTGGLFEVYDGADVDLYQYVELKAGMYRLECQGYYRFGQSWDQDPAAFGTDEWRDNAQLYVQNGAYNIDSDEFVGGRLFQCPLMPRLFDFQETKIYDMAAAGDESSWDMSDGDYGEKGWGPCSVPGSLMWFNAGKYQPYNKDGVRYNSVSFFVAQDGYVKLGVSKKEVKGADSFMVTNFKLYYEGEAGEAVEIAALQDDISNYYKKCLDLCDEHVGLLSSLLGDAVIEQFDDVYNGYESSTDKAYLNEALTTIMGLYSNAASALKSLEELKTAVSGMQNLASSTNYPGKAAFEAAIEKAESYVNENYEYSETDTFDTFKDAHEALVEARNTYLKSQEPVNGMYDYTAFVSYPWFCLPEYEPTWDAESGKWIPNEAALNTTAADGNLWKDKDDVNGTINDLAKGVNVYGKEGTPGVWAQGGTEGGNLEVYWNDNLTCVKKWAMPVEGYHDVSQLVTGIPNGYYKIKALGQTWGNDWADNCRLQIYIKSSTMEAFSPYLPIGGWWGKNTDQWLELETDMIQVTDGQVTVAFRDNGFAAWTGMRLYYYGETPDFSSLLTPTLEKTKANAETLAWPGDKAAVEALFAEIVSPIVSQDEYAAALNKIAEINAYVEDAANAIKQHEESTVPQFDALIAKYEGAESDIATQGFMAAFMLGDAESTDTYKDALEAAKNLSAYQSYLDYRVAMGDLAKEAELAAVIASQDAVLTTEPATAQQLADYQKALAAPYNKALLSSLGIDKASVDKPVDITTLIVNPKYDEDQTGWDGTPLTFSFGPSTVEQPHTAEVWNVNANISQTIYSLPAGCYRVQCQAIYRDGGDAQTAYNNWDASAGEMEYWENANAKLFANERSTSVVSLASYKSEERSYDVFRDKMIEAPEGDAQGNIVWIEHFNYQFKKEVTKDNGDIEYVDMTEEDAAKTDWWWDNAIYDAFDEKTYYYPASLYGISQRFEKSPEAYINQVEVMVEEGGTLTFGIRKDKLIGGDWIVMDNWKLFYLGTETPSAVESVATEAVPVAIYNAAGVQTKTTQKGVNIIKYSDNSVRKVLK